MCLQKSNTGLELVFNFQENDILKNFAPQNVESEKSNRSMSAEVFFLLPSCYFNLDSHQVCSNLLILGWLKHDPKFFI